jgi:hypothetical protein
MTKLAIAKGESPVRVVVIKLKQFFCHNLA